MLRLAATAAVLTLLLCSDAAAQRLTGQVLENGRPVNAAFVTLLSPDGSTRISAFLSDSTGTFFFDVPAPGRYVLRAERIGHATAFLDIDVPTAGLAVRMEAPANAVALDAIEVRGDGRCTVRPTSAAAAARIWDEARKSLELTRYAAAREDLTFRGVRFVRQLDARGANVVSELIRPHITSGTRAFRPVDPDVLDTIGFIAAFGDSLEFFAPDAGVLLSDQFLDDHCFEAVSGEDGAADRVGLRFRPVPERRVPEIEGTVWLDARTAALLFLEYEYVQARGIVPLGSATGRVDFARTASGLVYVERWSLRMPRIVEQRGRHHIQGWVEEGGFVQVIGGGRD
jgi:Carboxypeptidase regulatory-like domain